MRLEGLVSPLSLSEDFKILLKDINSNKFPIGGAYGLADSGKNYFIGNIFDNVDESLVIFTHSDVEARKIYEDLSLYTTEVYYLPTKEVVFYNIYAISGDLRWERLKVINEILSPKKKIIITCIDSLGGAAYIPKELYTKYTFKLSVGDIVETKLLEEKLVKSGYERVDIVENKGEFSVRGGGIIDIYPPISSEPYRLEFFGDEIDSIRNFNVNSQRSIEKVNNINIFPAKEVILEEDNINLGLKNIKADLDKLVSNLNKKEDKDKIESIINSNLEQLNESWSFENIDTFLPYFYKKTDSLLDYIEGSFIIVDDVKRCLGKLDSTYLEFNEDYNKFLEKGNILPKQAEIIHDKERIIEQLEGRKLINIENIKKTMDKLKPKSVLTFNQITLQGYNGKIEFLIDDIKEKKKEKYKILILSGTRSRGERLVTILEIWGG